MERERVQIFLKNNLYTVMHSIPSHIGNVPLPNSYACSVSNGTADSHSYNACYMGIPDVITLLNYLGLALSCRETH